MHELISFSFNSNGIFRPRCNCSSNASLILACDSAELVALCKIMLWKTHIPVRTQKRPPRLIFAGACHGKVVSYSMVTLAVLKRL